MKKPSKLLTLLAALLILLFSLSAAIALPILWRGWYYLNITALDLPGRTGLDVPTITTAFDQVMDYLLKDAPFGTGALPWSASGMAHFADCKVLFRLDLFLLAAAFLLLLLWVLRGCFTRRFGARMAFSPPLLALILTAVLFLLLGAWAFWDFESLFTAFHALCFPGKTNWVFDWRTDQIILILPEDFWLRTAALVAGVTLALEGLLSLLYPLLRRLGRPRSVYEELKQQRSQG